MQDPWETAANQPWLDSAPPNLGATVTGLAMGLGASPTHELIRTLQETKKNRKAENNASYSGPFSPPLCSAYQGDTFDDGRLSATYLGELPHASAMRAYPSARLTFRAIPIPLGSVSRRSRARAFRRTSSTPTRDQAIGTFSRATRRRFTRNSSPSALLGEAVGPCSPPEEVGAW
jgi:hypothetical protein